MNVAGTFNVLEACAAAGVGRLIYSSSGSVYGDAVEVPMTEEHPVNNHTFYGATKVTGEQMCRAFYHRYGLEYVALRYTNVYGPRQDDRGAYTSVIMKTLERLDGAEAPIIYGDGSQSYDFVHVRAAARANAAALITGAVDEAFNVGTGVATTINELVECLLRLTGARCRPEYRPAGQTFVQHGVGSTAKADKLLDFRAEIAVEEGLRDLISWRTQAGTGR